MSEIFDALESAGVNGGHVAASRLSTDEAKERIRRGAKRRRARRQAARLTAVALGAGLIVTAGVVGLPDGGREAGEASASDIWAWEPGEALAGECGEPYVAPGPQGLTYGQPQYEALEPTVEWQIFTDLDEDFLETPQPFDHTIEPTLIGRVDWKALSGRRLTSVTHVVLVRDGVVWSKASPPDFEYPAVDLESNRESLQHNHQVTPYGCMPREGAADGSPDFTRADGVYDVHYLAQLQDADTGEVIATFVDWWDPLTGTPFQWTLAWDELTGPGESPAALAREEIARGAADLAERLESDGMPLADAPGAVGIRPFSLSCPDHRDLAVAGIEALRVLAVENPVDRRPVFGPLTTATLVDQSEVSLVDVSAPEHGSLQDAWLFLVEQGAEDPLVFAYALGMVRTPPGAPEPPMPRPGESWTHSLFSLPEAEGDSGCGQNPTSARPGRYAAYAVAIESDKGAWPTLAGPVEVWYYLGTAQVTGA